MILSQVSAERDRINKLFDLLSRESSKVDILAAATFGQFMAVKSGGFIETTVQLTMYEYARRHSNSQIAGYVFQQSKYLNSLNCEKIERFISPFNKDWWTEVSRRCGPKILDSIDSLKNVRDDVAHGKHNGTGLITIREYFRDSVTFSKEMQEVLLGP